MDTAATAVRITYRARVRCRWMKRFVESNRPFADLVARAEIAADCRGDDVAINHHGYIAQRKARCGAEDAKRQDDVGMPLTGESEAVREMERGVVLTVEWIELRSIAPARGSGDPVGV